MDEIYTKIWKLAKPYYLRGRPMDIDHIEWFMETTQLVCKREHLDASILIPLAILHDVGYSEIQNVKLTNYYQTDIRRAHMATGRQIGEKILKSINYPEDKIRKIVNYIAVHDNWAFGEVKLFINDPILGTFKDLDYLWIYTAKGSQAIQKVLGKTDKEMLKHLINEPSPIFGKKPFSNKTTQELHDQYLKEREAELEMPADIPTA